MFKESTCVCAARVLHNSNCPLCGRFVRDGERAEHYPAYEMTRPVKVRYLLQFLFLVAGGITLFVDFIVGFYGWSIHAVVGLLMLWFMVFKPIFAQMGMAAVIVRAVVLICLWAAGMDIWGGAAFDGWPSSFLMPGTVALGITMVFFFSLVRTVKWSEVGVYVFSLTLINIVFLILGLFNVIPNMVLILSVLMYSIICLFTMSWFFKKRMITGFKKRLHV